MITCTELTKTYGSEYVIDGFSGTLPESGFVLLLGESGSGKTTFLNLLAGFLPFEGGSILWGETVFEKQVRHPQDPPFDYITQDSFFVDFLTVEENLHLLGRPELTLPLLERFGLAERQQAYPSTLSGGERGRLAVIRALIKEKRVLFLDEPTAALDEENKKTIFETLASLKGEVLILCATHDTAAVPYADVILHFSKTEKTPEKETVNAAPRQTGKKAERIGQRDLPDPRPYLKKWFSSSRREQHAKWLYLVFLTVSVLLLLWADTPAHKSAATCAELYHINTLHLAMTKGKQLKDLSFDRDAVAETAVDYRGSCPGLDSFIWVLPEDEDLFQLKDALACGTYYTEPQQVILSYEMAESMMPGRHEKLIGRKLTRTFYKLGEVELEITGILRKLDRAEQLYMNACGAEYNLDDPDSQVYSMFFVNAALLKEFADDPGLSFGEGQRAYCLYFDTYAARNRFLEKYQEAFRNEACYLNTDAVHPIEEWEIPYLFWVLLPLSVLAAVFTVVFFAELSKTEFVYNNAFVSVFEYAGFERKRILKELVRLGTLEFLKLFGLAALLAGALSAAANLLNHRLLFADYELFTYNLPLLAAYAVILTGLTVLLLWLRLRTVRLRSWYENLIASRDVL